MQHIRDMNTVFVCPNEFMYGGSIRAHLLKSFATARETRGSLMSMPAAANLLLSS